MRRCGRRVPGRALTTLALALGAAALPLGLARAPAAAAAGTGLSASASPCAPAAGSPACTVEPATISASWPTGSVVGGVVLAWDGTGRPARSPAPAGTRGALSVAAGGCMLAPGHPAVTNCSWAWPAALRLPASGPVLNGTYRLTACANDPTVGGGPATCADAALGTGTIQVGVGPQAPGGLTATGAPTVSLHWTAVAVADLAGYRLQRDGVTVWGCSANAAPGASNPCPAGPGATDQPPAGCHTYTVTSVRYGSTPGALLTSGPSSPAVVAVPGAPAAAPAAPRSGAVAAGGGAGGGATGASQGGSGGPVALPGAPYVGPARPSQGVTAAPAVGAAAAAPDPGYGQTLPYGSETPAAAPLAPGPPVGRAPDTGSSRASVHRAALFAAGMLLLAVAAHLIVLKGEVTRREALFRAFRHISAAASGPVRR